MQGEVTINNDEYHFSFEEGTFELTIYGLPGIIFLGNGEIADENIKNGEVLEANCFGKKYPYIKFIVKNVLTNYSDRILIKVLYYLETNRIVGEFDAMSFASDELNSFYDIKHACDTTGFGDDGQVDIRVKNFKEVNKDFIFKNDDDLKNITLNFFRQINIGRMEMLTIFTDMQLKFKKSQDFNQIFDHYYLIYNFFRFITYRNNICFNSINLKVIRNDKKYENVGQLRVFIDKDNFYIEKDKVKRDRQIKAVYLDDKIISLIDLIKSGRLYMDHYPESSADKRHITPSRFLLVTAAFEWEVEEVYGNYKYKENEKFREATDLIYDILEKEKDKFSGKKKRYINNYQRSFKYTGVSLSEKIQHALKDNDEVLSDFIKKIYKINGIDDNNYTYNKIAERIGKQRNNYAHGQIDREMDPLVILDFIVLEWLLYAMRLKQFDFDSIISKKVINELFGQNFYIK